MVANYIENIQSTEYNIECMAVRYMYVTREAYMCLGAYHTLRLHSGGADCIQEG